MLFSLYILRETEKTSDLKIFFRAKLYFPLDLLGLYVSKTRTIQEN